MNMFAADKNEISRSTSGNSLATNKYYIK